MQRHLILRYWLILIVLHVISSSVAFFNIYFILLIRKKPTQLYCKFWYSLSRKYFHCITFISNLMLLHCSNYGLNLVPGWSFPPPVEVLVPMVVISKGSGIRFMQRFQPPSAAFYFFHLRFKNGFSSKWTNQKVQDCNAYRSATTISNSKWQWILK